MKVSRSHALREQILETFIGLLSSEGLELTTLDKIAKRLGMRRNHVGYYFPSRASLIEGAVVYCVGVGQEVTVESLKSARSVRAIVSAWSLGAFEWIARYPDHGAVIMVFLSQCRHDERFRKLNSEILSEGIVRVVAILADHGVTHPKLVASLRKIQIYNMGLLISHLTKDGPRDIKDEMALSKAFALETLREILKK